MRYRYCTCDVFSEARFGGNPLAVLADAEGLSSDQMQRIAREFNYSETTFVLDAEGGHTRRVRIFTPAREVPFAGHPNIGTAFVLAAGGAFGELPSTLTVTFEELAGPVPVTIERRGSGELWCELSAPEPLTVGDTVQAGELAAAVSLSAGDMVTDRHLPRVASVGLPFLIAELRDRDALARARPDHERLRSLAERGLPADVHLYVRSGDAFDIRARMFAPLDGVPEDPATGSANCALAGLLAHVDPASTAAFRWRIAQGVEMGRPSVLEAGADKRDGAVVGTRVGGFSVMVCEGTIEVG